MLFSLSHTYTYHEWQGNPLLRAYVSIANFDKCSFLVIVALQYTLRIFLAEEAFVQPFTTSRNGEVFDFMQKSTDTWTLPCRQKLCLAVCVAYVYAVYPFTTKRGKCAFYKGLTLMWDKFTQEKKVYRGFWPSISHLYLMSNSNITFYVG